MTDEMEQKKNLQVYHVVTAIRRESILPVLPRCSKGRKHHYSPPKAWQLCDDMLNARAQWSGNHRLAIWQVRELLVTYIAALSPKMGVSQ